MSYIFPPGPVSAVPIEESKLLYAVNRIYCVGQNYRDHVREMGGDPKKNPPVGAGKEACRQPPERARRRTGQGGHRDGLIGLNVSRGRAARV